MLEEAEIYNLTLNGSRLLQKNYTFEATDEFYVELNASKNGSKNDTDGDGLDGLLADLDQAVDDFTTQQSLLSFITKQQNLFNTLF